MFRAGFVTWLLFLLLLKLGALNVHLGFVIGCHEAEREALLKFKQSLNDTQNRLSSWEGKDCCLWEGVGCDNVTSYVNRLDLHDPCYDPDCSRSMSMISAKLDRSLVEKVRIIVSILSLSKSTLLDTSNLSKMNSQIPGFVGSFKRLRYLNLSSSNFDGVVPSQLGNLTRLHTLDLSMSFSLSSDLNWVSRLVSLRYLNMNFVYINLAMNSTNMLNMPPLLGSLQLSGCELNVSTLTSLFSNFTWISTIQQVDLSSNYLRGSLPIVFVNMTSLRHLDLSGNQISGSIPYWLKNMRKLQHLDLSSNWLKGPFPRAFANMTSLTYLDLSQNSFSGSIPFWIQNMEKLQHLGFGENNFSQVEGGAIMGVVGKLCKLKSFDLSSNYIGGEIGAHHNLSKCATYDLENLELIDNMIGGILPTWLGDFKSLKILNIANNAIEGPIPVSIGSLSYLEELDISGNSVNGTIPQGLRQCKALVTIDLWSNKLQPLEYEITNLNGLIGLNLSHNHLTGIIPKKIGKMTSLESLDLSNNNLSGTIPSSMSNLTSLSSINLSNNKLFGTIPDC
ncbi:hypothetical protein RND81_12G142300 [Saponaria officinalis]|uniref:Leucine-rich repeat-containing N-terminal plant-type domain-containing protein n=1 Tax=Saponaria officinalis TaxID=3572 RepID=A0AAW1HAH8_SAPOF